MQFWIHANTGGVFNAFANQIDEKGKVKWPNSLQSIAYNDTGSEAIVKVDVEDDEKTWVIDNVIGHPKVIRVYTAVDHSDIFNFFYTEEWSTT